MTYAQVSLPPGEDTLYLRLRGGDCVALPAPRVAPEQVERLKRDTLDRYRESHPDLGPPVGFFADLGDGRFIICAAEEGAAVITRTEFESWYRNEESR